MMIKRLVFFGLILDLAAVFIAGCTSSARPTPSFITPMPSSPWPPPSPGTSMIPTPVAPAVTPRVPAVVAPSSSNGDVNGTPAARDVPRSGAGLLRRIQLGVPAGDSYVPTDIAVDAARGVAYVYHARSTQGSPVITEVGLADNQVRRQIVLSDFLTTGSGGALMVAPDGTRAYVTERDTSSLAIVDLATGTTLARIAGVRDAALSPDGKTLFVIDQDAVRAFDTSQSLAAVGLPVRWEVELPGAIQVIANGGRVLVSRSGLRQELVLLDGTSGRILATQPLSDYSQALAHGPDGGWAVRTGGSQPRVQRFDADLRPQAAVTVTDWGAFYYDEPRDRYILTGYRSPRPDLPANPVIVTLAARDLATQAETVWPVAWVPDLFVAMGENRLLGLVRYSGAQLMTLDPSSFVPTARAILGVQLTAAALDPTTATLFVADNQERIHVLDWPSGRVRTIWPGAAPLALDAADQRLYVNRADRVVALDSRRGDILAEFDRGGLPAPDGLRDRVYIVNAGVTIHDRAGRTVGRLDKTFPTPQGFSPNPRAIAAHVNPVNGYLVVEMNNGVPGSNNSDFLQVYAPGNTTPIDVPALYNFVHDIVFDPNNGTTYVSYAGKGNETIQHLQATGGESSRLLGRTGLLILDDAASTLRAYYDGVLALVGAASLTLQGADRAPQSVDQILFDRARRRLVVRDESSSRLDVVALDDLPPLTMRPRPVNALPERPMSDLQVTSDDQGTVLYTRIDNQLFRSRDGQRWEQLPVGSWASYGQLTIAGPGILFYTNQAEGGSDGVLRSRDGGDTWEFVDTGLGDLRLVQPVVARGAGTAYAMDRSGRLLAWRPAMQRWETILASSNAYTPLGTLSLAPDGTLLLMSYERYRRSTDDGQTWTDVPLPGPGGTVLGFATDDAAELTAYGFFGIDSPFLARSRDGGLTWEPLTTEPPIQPYAPNFRFAVAHQTLYLYTSDYVGNARLARSLDEGATWQEADITQLQGSHQLALATDGRLWLGRIGSAQVVDPANLRWTSIEQPGILPSVTPPPTLVPTPTAVACAQALSAREAAVAAVFGGIGCPKAAERRVPMVWQSFQEGQMVWESEQKTIFALPSDGLWQRHPDLWQSGTPESDPSLVAPEGLLQPVRGFGKVWREWLDGPVGPLAWATATETSVAGSIQEWDGGLVLRVADDTLALYHSGEWRSQ